MRPNQQNKRSRNRGGNRKNQNPLTRSYESNGPDVRIRGTAQHIADKYSQLARDANSAGDSVAAENYMQHAEHYSRIILSAQAQQQARNEQAESSDDVNESESQVNGAAKGDQSAESDAKATPSRDGDEGERAPRRERRPRRRRASGDDSGDASDAKQTADPANAPQPSLNELPSFVTGDAAEVKAAE